MLLNERVHVEMDIGERKKMQSMAEAIKKKLMVLTMVVVMLTSTVMAGNVEIVQADTTVYVTRTGSKYHTHKCGNGTYYAASRSSARARGLTPCKKCFPGGDSGSSSSANSSSQRTQTSVKNMRLNKSELELVKGQTADLKVSDAPGNISWSSGDSSVVAISSGGKLTAKGKGKATITVSSGNQKKQCRVTVEDPMLNRAALTMNLKDVSNLKLTGCKHSVKWYSSDTDIVKVSNGKLTAKGVGKAVVKAKVHGETYSCKVTVKKPQIKSIKIGQYDAVMDAMDWQEVEIRTNPSYAQEYYDVSVSSSDPSVISTELEEGWGDLYVELHSENRSGQATITVSAGGKSTSFTVEVICDEENTDDEIDEQMDEDVDEWEEAMWAS